jgi:hypothetical protein
MILEKEGKYGIFTQDYPLLRTLLAQISRPYTAFWTA